MATRGSLDLERRRDLWYSMSTHTISSIAEAWQLATAWRELAGPHPFRSPEWCLTWFEHYSKASELCIFVDYDDQGGLQGLAPLVWQQTAVHGRLQFLANGQACTDYNAFFVKDDSPEVMRRLVQAIDNFIRRKVRYTSVRVELDGISADSGFEMQLLEQSKELHYSIRQQPIEASYVLSLPLNFASLRSGFNRNLRRKFDRINHWFQTGEVQFHRTKNQTQLLQRMSDLVHLHQRRRKMLGQAGVFATQQFTDFLTDAAQRLAGRNQAEIHWCEMRGRIVSAQLVLLHEQTISTYINGMDPEFMAEEPGFSLVAGTAQNAIERGFRTYDFLRGEELYKRHWRAQLHPLNRLYLTPNCVVPLLYDSAYDLARNVKHFAQNLWSR